MGWAGLRARPRDLHSSRCLQRTRACCRSLHISPPAALTSLALEQQEEEAWLPPPDLLHLTRLCHLSISGNDCS